jgi:anthranilate synthase component II
VTRPRVVVVDHHDSYTWNLVHLLALVTGTLPDVVQHDETALDSLARYTHLVLSPGPGRPGDPADFALGPGVFDLGVPVLGVCLGMQALVTSYGGQVGPAAPAHGDVAEVTHDGTGPFAGLPTPFRAVRYHSLVAHSVPSPLVENAWCDGSDGADGPGHPVVMGVRHESLPLWGVQFHPESVLTEHGAAMVAGFLELS